MLPKKFTREPHGGKVPCAPEFGIYYYYYYVAFPALLRHTHF
jgi:hypothetical protein